MKKRHVEYFLNKYNFHYILLYTFYSILSPYQLIYNDIRDWNLFDQLVEWIMNWLCYITHSFLQTQRQNVPLHNNHHPPRTLPSLLWFVWALHFVNFLILNGHEHEQAGPWNSSGYPPPPQRGCASAFLHYLSLEIPSYASLGLLLIKYFSVWHQFQPPLHFWESLPSPLVWFQPLSKACCSSGSASSLSLPPWGPFSLGLHPFIPP